LEPSSFSVLILLEANIHQFWIKSNSAVGVQNPGNAALLIDDTFEAVRSVAVFIPLDLDFIGDFVSIFFFVPGVFFLFHGLCFCLVLDH
jgi:hypothetical protein